jgi:U3 small nucleolar RNA-associated protein 15
MIYQILFYRKISDKSIFLFPLQPDDSFICVGMSDGLVQFLHRRVPPTLEERETERLAKAPFHKYRRFTQMPTVSPDDLVVQEDKKAKESRHDHFLRKFEYSKALDQVLKPYVMKKHPDYTYSVLRELQRRNGLRTAIAGRDEKSLVPLLQYLHRYQYYSSNYSLDG